MRCVLDFSALAWTQILPPTFEPCSGIDDLDPVRDRMIVFGGRASLHHLNDVWHPSLAGADLDPAATAGTPPSPRSGHAAIYDRRTACWSSRRRRRCGPCPLQGRRRGASSPWRGLSTDSGLRAIYDRFETDDLFRGGDQACPGLRHQPFWSRFYPNDGRSVGPRNNRRDLRARPGSAWFTEAAPRPTFVALHLSGVSTWTPAVTTEP
jgi:hypothetical protein